MSNNERTLLKFMLSEPSKNWLLEELLEGTGWDDQVHVAGSGKALSELGLVEVKEETCLLYTSPSPRDRTRSRMPSSA